MNHEHSTIREGLGAGLLGGLLALGWYVVFDAARGEPFQTPNALGQVFAARPEGGGLPAGQEIQPLAVVEYLILHFVVFGLLGIALAKSTHMATRNPALRMGVWLGLVIAFVAFLGYLLSLYWMTGQRFPWWSALMVDLLGVGSMGLYLWRRHPQLRASLRSIPLGSEVKPPPHPPGRPRA
ncbi:MAG: hypothetical protein QOH59_1174 [Gemmatimonadales bacterium]|jgi:hypothetical protein|nr:hypothetical protein [Gemmatimonadales bacterium]